VGIFGQLFDFVITLVVFVFVFVFVFVLTINAAKRSPEPPL
jgi:uncharacterized membrane protein